ncbi:alpha/beta hydrolase [Spirosoma sp. KUDC1026]|uniref:alpha/beta hydrolase n=1 Tax=Spirosoma sp. KUDC1026 TaxID=2745947 RepID=UPI00159B9DDB|nr:alpha/beta hydrolase-fold protein [Spirosoma sp. KUDC1026]QKZ13624.1 esterase family protein [Spirosoma sp. KUDC1026]
MADSIPASPRSKSMTVTRLRDDSLFSVPLQRTVHLDIILPPNYRSDRLPQDRLPQERLPQEGLPQDRLPQERLPVLYLNDGQDLERLHLTDVLDSLYEQQAVRPFVLVAIHAGDRIQEYGTAAQADYMHRGSKAALYTDFVLTELLPYVQNHYPVSDRPEESAFAGFSLGGLSALDLVFHHPDRFSRAGVFSGALWWRSKSTEAGYRDETDRIMHDLVRKGNYSRNLKFWFEAGTDDETSDRNNNGIIDAIDDTIDLIEELTKKGYQYDRAGGPTDIRYVEVQGGKHDQETWSRVMPDFLTWAFGK